MRIKLSPYTLAYPLAILLSSPVLANDNYVFDAAYTAEYWQNAQGGIKTDGVYLDNLDLSLAIDAQSAWGIEGGSAYIQTLYNNSNTLSEAIVGDLQTVSNIDNTQVFLVFELWYQQEFLQNHSVKVGLYDLNSEFDAIETAGLFINSSHGIGADYSQSGENGPSIFPVTSLAVRYLHRSDNFSWQVAILDAVPGDPDDDEKNTIHLSSDEGALIALEGNYQQQQHRIALGSWYYSEESDTLESNQSENNYGLYGIYEYVANEQQNNALSAWLRFGLANDKINQVSQYAGTGLTLTRFLSARPDDILGFAIARVKNSDDYLAVGRQNGVNMESSETNFEFTYQAQFNDHLTIQPNIQYIVNPGTDPALDNALVYGLRVVFEL